MLFSTHPEVRMTVDHQGALDELIRTLQEVVAGDDTGVVDQNVHLAHLTAHLLGRHVHTLPLAHVTYVGVNLGLERRDLLYSSDRTCGIRAHQYKACDGRGFNPTHARTQAGQAGILGALLKARHHTITHMGWAVQFHNTCLQATTLSLTCCGANLLLFGDRFGTFKKIVTKYKIKM